MTAATASSTVDTKATLAEPIGGPNDSPFVCPADESCGSGEWVHLGHVDSEFVLFGGGCGGACDLRTEPLSDGTLVLDETASNPQVPGKSYNQPYNSYGQPLTLTLTDTVDGALSTGRYAGATGTLTGQVHLAGGMATITLAGTISLGS